LVAVLLTGLVVGGSVGYHIGAGTAVETAQTVLAIAPPPGPADAPPSAPPAASPASTSTDEVVEIKPAAIEPQPRPTPAAARLPERTPPPTRPFRTAPGAGTIDIDSRPRGAKVFVDGRPMGTTPLRVPELSPGSHRVRLDLVGYRTVTSTVNIVGGELARLGVTLEQMVPGRPATGRNR
jgi:hypothetical protein